MFNIKFRNQEKVEVESVEHWRVTWYSRCGEFYDDLEKQARFFTKKGSAEEFAAALVDAFKLLKHTGKGTKVYIEKIKEH